MKVSPYIFPLLAFKERVKIRRPKKSKIEMVANIIGQELNVDPKLLLSKSSHHRNITEAKHLLRKIMSEEFGMTLNDIALQTGSISHTTVHHSISRATMLVETDKLFKEIHKQIIKKI